MKRRIAPVHGTTQPAQIESHGEGFKDIPLLYLGNDLTFQINRIVIGSQRLRVARGAADFRHFLRGEVEHRSAPHTCMTG